MTAGIGVFGGFTRWAVVFLIIFVLFFLLVPGYGYGAVARPYGAYPGAVYPGAVGVPYGGLY
ncbi:hypothetical protein [Effusibacillus consociatus]|uniref:Sporulation protein YjcZ n=1 Tax=Effusibacillus consociatus TaxID=1117041 RepID=A0ABV9Q654_9BACL